MARKKRNDRNHIIYQITAPNGDRYLGITFVRGRALKRSAKVRWEAHVRNALDYDRQNLLSLSIRKHGAESSGEIFWKLSEVKVLSMQGNES